MRTEAAAVKAPACRVAVSASVGEKSNFQAQSMSIVAAALGALYAGRPVINQTGLKGLYDFSLQWTPDRLSASVGPGGALPETTAGPSFVTALDEELGLQLKSAKGPLPVLVIDSIERPSDN